MRSREQQVVEDAVAEMSVAMLSDIYPVAIEKRSGGRVILRCAQARLRIGWNYNHVSVGISRGDQVSDNFDAFIRLYYALEVIAPQLSEYERYPRDMTRASEPEIRADIHRQVALVRDHCGPLLNGDSMQWQAVEAWYQDWLSARQRQPDESLDHYAERTLAAFRLAIDNALFWRATEWYWWVPSQYLTKEDKRKMKMADKHTFMIR